MPKYLSGRVKRTPQDQLTEDRYLYLGLDQAEPNLGDPPEVDPIPGGETQYQIISVQSRPGERFWKEIGGGTIPAAHTVRDEGVVIPKNALFPNGNPNPNAGINSITDVNFAGLGITVTGTVDENGFPGTGVTVTVFAPGDDHGVLFNNDGEFATSSFFTFDNTVGIESVGIGTNLRVQGDLKLDKTIYDEDNQPGTTGDLLVKTATGGMQWSNPNAVQSGAGGDVGQVQFHGATGLVDGADNFYFDDSNNRVGIGSTQPEKLLDVLGYSRFTGDVEFVTSNQKNILFDENDNSLIFGDSIKAKFGDDKDASIYHDDTDFYIDNGKGNLILSVGLETAFLAVPNNRVELFYDNLKRFETTSTGIAITGTDSSIHGEVGIQSHIKLPNNAKIQFGLNNELEISRDLSDNTSKIRENGSGNLSIEGSDIVFRNSSTVPADNKIYAQFKNNDSVNLYWNNEQKFQTTGLGVSVTGLTTTTDLSVTGFVTSHLIPGKNLEYDLGSASNAWNTIYAKSIIGVDNEEFQFLKAGIATITTEFHVSGISSFIGVATFHSDIDVDGLAELDDVNVTGILTTKDLHVSGISSFVGVATFHSDIDVDGFANFDDADVSGILTTNNLNVTGVSTFVGLATFGNGIHVTTGISTFSNDVEMKLDLDVDGRTDVDEFFVSENAEFDKDIKISGVTSTKNLYVTGISTFNDHIRAGYDNQIDIGSDSVGFRTVFAKEFTGKAALIDESLVVENLKVNGISTFIGIATFGGGINVTSGITTVGFLTAKGIFVTGVTTATDFNSLSDRNFKTNIQVIDNPIEKIMKIDGVSFNWKSSNKPSFGVIADNVQETLPDLVNDEDPKTVNYNGLVGLLIEVVKNQQEQINELRSLLDK